MLQSPPLPTLPPLPSLDSLLGSIKPPPMVLGGQGTDTEGEASDAEQLSYRSDLPARPEDNPNSNLSTLRYDQQIAFLQQVCPGSCPAEQLCAPAGCCS